MKVKILIIGIIGIVALIIVLGVIPGTNPELSPRKKAPSCEIPEYGKIFTKDTVLCPGEYIWPEDIYPGMTLLGNDLTLECQGKTTIIGFNLNHGIDIFGDNNILKDCTFKNFKHPIHIEGKNNQVINNKVYGPSEYGIHLANGGGHIIDDNLIENSANSEEMEGWMAIGLYPDSPGNKIRNNVINWDGFFGIYQHGGEASNDLISGNEITGPIMGITLSEGSDSVTVSGNTVSDSRLGINIETSAINNIIKENTIQDTEVGIFAQYESKDNQILDNTLGNTNQKAIEVAPNTEAIVMGN